MTDSHDSTVQRQFGPQAQAYVESAVHAQGEDLDWIARRAADIAPGHALDLGTGGGHVAYALAPHAGRVTASDLSADMVEAVKATAAGRGLAHVEGVVAPAEALPFADASFDMIASRFTAHHWRDFGAGLREARRVLKPGAPALFVDIVAPEHPLADTALQAIELLRDPSHVRDYRADEWMAALGRAGFTLRQAWTRRVRIDFASWIARMNTPPAQVEAIRTLLAVASEQFKAHVALEADGSFMLDSLAIEVI